MELGRVALLRFVSVVLVAQRRRCDGRAVGSLAQEDLALGAGGRLAEVRGTLG